MLKSLFLNLHRQIEGAVEYPYLKEGSIGVQIGFDMSSKNPTSDLFVMSQRVGKTGLAIGIDPDDTNIRKAKEYIEKNGITNIRLIQSGTYREKKTLEFQLTKRSSHNQLTTYHEVDKQRAEGVTSIEVDTLDHILLDIEKIDLHRVRHINITNNNAEFDTLLGMPRILDEANDLSIALISGRTRKGAREIDGRPVQDVIMELLEKYGFSSSFYRMNELLWWGIYKKLLLKRKWIFDGNLRYGVVIASKGRQAFKWHHSYMA